MHGLQICWPWSLTDESLSQTQKGHKGFSLEGMFLKLATFIYKLYTDITLFKHELMLHIFKGSNFYLQIIHWYSIIQAWTAVTCFYS